MIADNGGRERGTGKEKLERQTRDKDNKRDRHGKYRQTYIQIETYRDRHTATKTDS